MKKSSRGLTHKQELVILDQINRIERGKGVNLTDSFDKIYNTKNRRSAQSMASTYWRENENFRNALIEGLINNGVIGRDSKVEKRLNEGLDAVKVDSDGEKHVDYKNRLDYVKEINRITGAYAPDKSETRRMTLNVKVSDKELDKKINQLQNELEGGEVDAETSS